MKQAEVDFSQFPRRFENIRYAQQSKEQMLDVALPNEDGAPLVVFVHGGGWAAGGRRSGNAAAALRLVHAGYAVATVDYRLTPEGVWPKQVHDVKAAIRFLRENSAQLRLNADKIVLWGNSAGGHIAQIVAATGGGSLLEERAVGCAAQSSKVDGLISWYAISEPAELDADIEKQTGEHSVKHGAAMSCRPCQMAGFVINENKARARALGSIAYVQPEFPPVLLQHGKADPLVSYLQSVRLYDRVNEVCGSGRAVLELFSHAVHGDSAFSADENVRRVVRFIDGIFGIHAREEIPLPAVSMRSCGSLEA